jgi:hypothetical protein
VEVKPINTHLRSRIRRVKCDEGKPKCQRCLKFGVKCDGYLPPAHELRNTANNRGILPRIKKVSSSSPNLLVPISVARLENPKEQRYFDLFCGQTSFEIMPEHDSFGIRQMLLQACYSEKSLKHAIVALGALDKTAETTRDFSKLSLDIVPAAQLATANEHHRFALVEYTQAVAEMRAGIKLNDVRTTLLSILLIFVFEAWNGNMAMAVRQIRNGVRIIQEWKSTIKDSDKTPEYMSPAPHIVEHDLIRIYLRLVTHKSYFYNQDSEDLEALETLGASNSNLGKEYLDSMPTYFTTIGEAVSYQQALYKRGTLFFAGFVMDPPPPGSSLAIELVTEQQYTAAKTAQWLKAFVPIFEAFKSGFSTCESRLVRTAKTLVMIGHLTVCTFFSDQIVYDSYNNTFAEIISLLTESLALQPRVGRSRPTNYSLGGRTISTLWVVGIRCRDEAIRRKTIELLVKYPRREGLWDGLFVANIVKFIMDHEEQYLEDDKVPGWARISSVRWDTDLEKRTGTLICEQRISRSSDEVVTKTRDIIW